MLQNWEVIVNEYILSFHQQVQMTLLISAQVLDKAAKNSVKSLHLLADCIGRKKDLKLLTNRILLGKKKKKDVIFNKLSKPPDKSLTIWHLAEF